MATLTFTGSRPTPRQKSVLIVGQVNAEPITVVVDESWNGLQLELQFFHSVTHPEVPVVVILDSTMTCNVPPEVTKEVGVVHVALAGRDSGTIIKLSEKLYYADAKIGADPQGGLTPEQQTPDYIAQMIAIQEETKAVAQSVRDDANQGKFNGKPGKNGEPGKSPKEEGGTWWLWNEEEQKWVDTGILAAGKNGISPKVSTQPVTGGTRVIITDADGEKYFDVLNGKNGNPGKNGETPNITIGKVDTLPSGSKATAEMTGQTPNLTLNMGIPQGREGPAGVGVPAPTPEDAGKVPTVNPEGDGYIFGEAGGGKIDDTALGRDTTWSSRMIVDSLAPAFESSGPVVTCNPVPGYPLSVASRISAVQSGTGDPSPDNVRPISGRSGATLTHNDTPITLEFGQTVYGGQLDWTTGKLAVDWVKYVADGTEKPGLGKENTKVKRWYFSPTNPTLGNSGARSILCNILKTVTSASADETGCICSGSNLISILLPKDSVQDADAVKGWLQANNPEFVYKTSKVETIQLSPTEILALTGANTIYTDTGDTTVSGRADPSATIKDLLARIDALEKAAIGGG